MLWPIFDENGEPNDDYVCHAADMVPASKNGTYKYRIPLMTEQVKTLFGKMPDGLDAFARQSQISQAEAKKYFIERFRLSKWRRTGIIWWNLIDGWPQISDAVVDWYTTKKLAYYYIKRSQQALCMMFDEPENGMLELYAVNDLTVDKKIHYTVRNITDDKLVCTGEATVAADSSVRVTKIRVPDHASFLHISWTDENGNVGENHFMSETLGISYEQYAKDIETVGFDEFEGF